ncbi:hypothetical protein [Photorhabdus temperata]|uniref:Uncharacterized protein n=1 Tax=Photorhabdus temperata J3 TaxID=1389415 RepID=U7QTH1_PHOTE|nr:hypothetical protein [Photorhabdus temperata]EQB98090.1 hypothetical protein B738_27037 [Photorhabdus temperata subsp. temperata M1021]ERT11168.1 hypothetical protein O185_20905 [Photorhabdus temperata J3]
MSENSMQSWTEAVLKRRKIAEEAFVNIMFDGCRHGRNYNSDRQEFSDQDKGLDALEQCKVVTFSGYDGVVTAWIDDSNMYHAEFTRYRREISRVSCVDKTELETWIKKWLPKIHEFN